MALRPRLHPGIEIIFSTLTDGSMAGGGGQPIDGPYRQNTDRFLAKHDFPSERTRVLVRYGSEQSYVDISRVNDTNAGGDILADALYTTDRQRVITLPVADCIATAVYDPVTGMLGVLHLGRHSSVAGLIEHFVIEVADTLGSDPRDWYVWMSPSLRLASDRLNYFDAADSDEWRNYVERRDDGVYIDMAGHNLSRFLRAGVEEQRVIISPIDTYHDSDYFSHRAAQEIGDETWQGRMVLAAYRQ